MLDRPKRLKILVEANRRNLTEIDWAIEALETGTVERTSYSTLQRAFHTIKHDASHLQLSRLARLAGAAEAIVEHAVDQKMGLPIELLKGAATEIRAATETVAAGGRHRLNEKLLARLEEEAQVERPDPRRSTSP